MLFKSHLLFGFVVFLTAACTKDQLPGIHEPIPEPVDSACLEVTYTQSIRPILSTTCAFTGCHEEEASIGDFTFHEGIKPFADNGLVQLEVVDQRTMPRGFRLTEEQIEQFRCWLNDGAPNN